MTTLTITVDLPAVEAILRRIVAAAADLDPPLREAGEYLVERTKQRFSDSKAPDGTPWAPNSAVTLARYLGAYQGSRKQDGSLSKRGAARAAGKRPLIGESKSLMTTINYVVSGNTLTIGSPMEYAATQQFGAQRGAFGVTRRGAPIPWGDIPARPFLGLSDDDQGALVSIFEDYLAEVLGV